MSTEDDLYFDYSFYDMGKYDLPAMLNEIRSATGYEKVSIFAVSQGTTSTFSALSENYDDVRGKINFLAAFAPVVQLRNTKNSYLLDWGNDADYL